jgi:hypothetical protein
VKLAEALAERAAAARRVEQLQTRIVASARYQDVAGSRLWRRAQTAGWRYRLIFS